METEVRDSSGKLCGYLTRTPNGARPVWHGRLAGRPVRQHDCLDAKGYDFDLRREAVEWIIETGPIPPLTPTPADPAKRWTEYNLPPEHDDDRAAAIAAIADPARRREEHWASAFVCVNHGRCCASMVTTQKTCAWCGEGLIRTGQPLVLPA